MMKYFSPPYFDDEETNRRGELLSFVLNLHIGIAVFTAIAELFFDPGEPIYSLAAAASILPAIGLRFLLHCRKVRLAAAIFVGFLAVLMPLVAWAGNASISSVIVTVFQAITIVMAGLLLGGWGAISFWFFTFAANSLLIYAENNNLYQVTAVWSNTEVLAMQIIAFGAIAVMLWLTNSLIQHSFLRARQSEQRYRGLLESIPAITYINGLDVSIPPEYVSPQVELLLGYTSAEFVQNPELWKEIIHPEDRERVLLENEQTNLSGAPFRIDYRLVAKDGRSVWIRDEAVLVRDSKNNPLHWLGIWSDISERKQAEELTTQVNFELQRRLKELYVLNAVAQAGASAKSEDEMLEAVVERLHSSLYTDIVGIGLWDEQAGMLRTHPSAHRGMPARIRHMTARLGDGVVGIVAATRQPYRVKDANDPYYQPVDLAIRSELCVPILAGDRLIGVLDVESKQANAFSESDENLLLTIAGQLASALERLRAEQQLRSLNAALEQRVIERTTQLEAANNELESFSYSVSHDLRAPLRAISGYSAILNRDFSDQLNPEGREFLNKVTKSSVEMNEKIEGLLAFSRLARSGLRKSEINLSQMVEEVIDMLRAAEPDRKVEWYIAPMLKADVDATLMRVVLENLLGNAWKYSSKAENARIEFGAQAQNNTTVYFVRDNGVGFNMKYADKLFGVFQRLHREEEFDGTGIGLATVQRIIQRHGGRIWAEAEVNKGATFYFTLERAEIS